MTDTTPGGGVGADGLLVQALAILDAIKAGGSLGQSASELRMTSGLPDAEVRDLLQRLERVALVSREGRRYRLGLRLFELGGSAPIPLELREAAIPFMGDLYEATHETIHFGILADADVLYIEKLKGHNPAHVRTAVGLRMPASCTALGKAILAYSPVDVVTMALPPELPRRTRNSITRRDAMMEELRQVAASGVAYDCEENEIGVVCVAAPVLSSNDSAVGALSITGPVDRFNPADAAGAVRTAARGLSSVLTCQRPNH